VAGSEGDPRPHALICIIACGPWKTRGKSGASVQPRRGAATFSQLMDRSVIFRGSSYAHLSAEALNGTYNQVIDKWSPIVPYSAIK